MARLLSLAVTLAALLGAGSCAHVPGGSSVPEGKSTFVFEDAKGRPDRPIPVHTYRPAGCDATCPLVIVLHGLQRNGADYRDYWVPLADKHRLVIAAPEFSQANWKGATAYNLGDTRSESDRERWTYSAIEHLFDRLADGRRDYVLFGHSAGGQFVHRLAFFLPDHRARVIVAANPGWYTMPEWRAGKGDAFPHSLAGARVGEPELRRALARPLVLLLGDADTRADDPSLDKSPASMRQGPHRYARGRHFFEASQAAAMELGVPFAWKLEVAPGIGHSGGGMSRAAAEKLFAKS